MIVLVDAIKGGPGKSTFVANLAVAHALEGKDVICVDADRQLSLSKFFHYRDELNRTDIPRVDCVIKLDDISRTLKRLESRCDVVVVDVAGAITQELVSALKVADVSICPVEAGQLNIDTLPDYKEQLDIARWTNPNLKDFYFLNKCTPLRTMDESAETDKQLRNEGMNLLDTWVFHNKTFGTVWATGLTVVEMDPSSKAYLNFYEFYNELKEKAQW